MPQIHPNARTTPATRAEIAAVPPEDLAFQHSVLRGCARRVQAVASRLSMRRIAAMPIIVSEVCTLYS